MKITKLKFGRQLNEYHSKNVQIVCIGTLKILNINAMLGLTMTPLFGEILNIIWLWKICTMSHMVVGGFRVSLATMADDSSYRSSRRFTPESLYNSAHMRSCKCVERRIRVPKSHFWHIFNKRTAHCMGRIINVELTEFAPEIPPVDAAPPIDNLNEGRIRHQLIIRSYVNICKITSQTYRLAKILEIGFE
ncbi:hypothetical protein FQA39_LY01913 [Lamprigera yunnana]|nr:hypothetical protein FQA39_LY01913 [Lamprigera yunnana]